MITLPCTKCADVLSVDDGFAGGVCRCCKCGTIQTVPDARAAAARSIWERDEPSARQPTSVDESGDDLPLDDRPPVRPTRATTPSAGVRVARQWPAILAVAVAGLLAIGVAAALWVTLERTPTTISIDARDARESMATATR